MSNTQAILRYQSYTQRILHVMAKALPLLIGWTEESQNINVVLLESYIEKKVCYGWGGEERERERMAKDKRDDKHMKEGL